MVWRREILRGIILQRMIILRILCHNGNESILFKLKETIKNKKYYAKFCAKNKLLDDFPYNTKVFYAGNLIFEVNII
jgi:hypothetical protein